MQQSLATFNKILKLTLYYNIIFVFFYQCKTKVMVVSKRSRILIVNIQLDNKTIDQVFGKHASE